jgi:hypothetical protein
LIECDVGLVTLASWVESLASGGAIPPLAAKAVSSLICGRIL